MFDRVTDSRVGQFLSEHPRILSILFTLLLLAQAGLAAAGETAGGSGGT